MCENQNHGEGLCSQEWAPGGIQDEHLMSIEAGKGQGRNTLATPSLTP
jgi:hypothetical protein